jgi:hypothetical protein
MQEQREYGDLAGLGNADTCKARYEYGMNNRFKRGNEYGSLYDKKKPLLNHGNQFGSSRYNVPAIV